MLIMFQNAALFTDYVEILKVEFRSLPVNE